MKNKQQIYSVMVEGTDDSLGYFMNFEVAADNPTQATKLARIRARELGLNVVGVEEITETTKTSSSGSQVLSVSGKSYFPTE